MSRMDDRSLIVGVGALLGLACVQSCAEPAPACGDEGTNSVALEDGGCVCAAGYTWEDADASESYDCALCSCASRQCGDDGCGSSCGTCGGGQFCNAAGECQTGACAPDCADHECGADLVCGQSCGTCDAGQFCNAGQCQTGACTPDCAGRECGPDPVCGQSCGSCVAGLCNAAGQCDGGAEATVGDACTSDSSCGSGAVCLLADDGFAGGYCTIFECTAGGCPGESECVDAGTDVCMVTCSVRNDCRAGYACYDIGGGVGVCWVADGPVECPATCPSDTHCAHNGVCVDDTPTAVPAGPLPDCSSVPSWECVGDESYCGELIAFEPDEGPGYWDYPANGETATNEYRSYARRDLIMLVKHAAAMTACLAAGWGHGNGGVLGLGDMSEADGAIPGTSDGDPGHPPLSHTDGHDMDIAYFQVQTEDNTLRAVCPHWEDDQEAYHCTGAPDILDWWRTALFVGELHASPQTLWIGVDGRIGPTLEQRIDELCGAGWLTNSACSSSRVEYETSDYGIGWYYFHHHHLHLSLEDQYGNHPEN